MQLVAALWCVAVLLKTSCLGVAISHVRRASPAVYCLCLLASLTAFGLALVDLVIGVVTQPALTLPLDLPWQGAHFRLDTLSAFFLIVMNLGAAAASLIAIGYVTDGAISNGGGRGVRLT